MSSSAAVEPSLGDRFRAHARALRRAGRSPLYAELMSAAADDLDRHGIVCELFAGLPVPRGSVPQLRLMAALHELVLSGGAPELAVFYPSAGGGGSPTQAWPAAREAMRAHREWIRERLPRTVQTNEAGRSAVLYAVLLWLADRFNRPIRLLEIGASAGLNLRADRYAYAIGAMTLGDAGSPLRFAEPWRPGPDIDLVAAQEQLEISHRAGCDLAPLDPGSPEDRRRLLSYIWADEPERLGRLTAALHIAAAHPLAIAAQPASEWLPGQLEQRSPGELTVVWHSIMRQYVPTDEWASVMSALQNAGDGHGARPVVRVAMEPRRGHIVDFELTFHADPVGPGRALATCGDHGPPVIWQPSA